MKTFRKTLISSLSLIVAVILLSVVIIEPAINKDVAYFYDVDERKELAGSIDFIVIGDSFSMNGFDCKIFNEKTSYNSYNLSNTMMTTGGTYFLLEKELERNPVKTVVIQISEESFSSSLLSSQAKNATAKGDGDSIVLQRTDNIFERMKFLIGYVRIDDWLNIYSRLLISGLSNFKGILLNENAAKKDVYRGCYYAEPKDMTFTETQAKEKYKYKEVLTDNLDIGYSDYEKIINLCRKYDVEIMFVAFPFSDADIWQCDGWDIFSTNLQEFCKKFDVPLYDFNLHKDRYEYFNDKESFIDYRHLSRKGSEKFTVLFSELISSLSNKEDASDLFYNSYKAMEEDSPYCIYKK